MGLRSCKLCPRMTRNFARTVIIGVAVSVALACSSAKPRHDEARTNVHVSAPIFKVSVGSAPLGPRQARIDITVPRTVTEFEAAPYGGAPIFLRYLSSFVALDEAGHALPTAIRGNTVAVTTSEAKTSSYTLSYLYDVPQSVAGEVHLSLPTLDAQHGRFDNNVTFLAPKGLSDQPAGLIVSAPTNVRVVTSWGESRRTQVARVAQLTAGQIVLGDYRYSSLDVGDMKVFFAIRGDYDEALLKQQFVRVLAQQLETVGKLPTRFLLVVFQDSTDADCKGTALTNSLLVNIRSGTKLEPFNFQAVGTISHELFHQWNYGLVRPLSDDGAYLLTEGFTNYFAIAALTGSGLLPPEGFARFLWRYRTFLQANPKYPGADYATIQSGFKTGDSELCDLAYTKGPFVAVLLDLALRQDTNGARGVGAWFHELGTRFGGTPGYTLDDLRAVTEAVSGKPHGKAIETFERAFLGGSALDLDKLFSTLGIACEPEGKNCKLSPLPPAEDERRTKLFTARP